jgi:hypothetical protein
MIRDSIQELTFRENIEKMLREKLGLPELRTGTQVIRNEKGWRQDEKSIEYIWIVIMNRSFVGSGGLIAIKFTENNFRGQHHPNELLRAIFSVGPDNGIKEFYEERTSDTGSDSVMDNFHLDLFNANKGITLDGVSYTIHTISDNIDTIITVDNPNTSHWKNWETEIWRIGKSLAFNSQSKELTELFG